MNWLQILLLLTLAYLLIAYYIRERGLFRDHITFFGPIMGIKTNRVGFFDWFRKIGPVLRAYATLGVVMVVVVSVVMTLTLVLAVSQLMVQTPEPTGIYDPRNILAIPGVNEAIPITAAVIIGLLFTMVIHEFGHAILARVEDMRVRSMGLLVAVVPIGAFVEPDEEDVDAAKGMPKIRMFGAGITNNIVIGLACFAAMFLLVGMATPLPVPLVQGVYQGFPAAEAGLPGYSVITSINGIPVTTQEDVAAIMDGTRPGETVTLTAEKDGVESTYTLTLAEWPEVLDGERDSGFMGVYYYSAPAVKDRIGSIADLGLLAPIYLTVVPIDAFIQGNTLQLGVLLSSTPEQMAWEEPFPFFWGLVHLTFWTGWFNLLVGMFNAIPIIPLDGGYMMKEGVERFFERRGWSQYSQRVVASISGFVTVLLILLITMPMIVAALRFVMTIG
ncbi:MULTISPECIES: site-2 protease family protein [Methanoculleus]|jgi:membrane-associated protease RseP (regulator of RpoE activity)|uniref:Membrane-associated protease RseP, regulator of RpoE activity n=1 Tax=Methanoculleus thermophilus TaxID=2200 RepID=A0A1G8ZFF1_9EURY|nr:MULTISPECIES: site-2 protease family protein [Methanoculleus]NLN08955.1 PDZ domain-containing protein [Methanoculleus thermophilus]SDK13832.1 Membrane-associated protease RseP, regulator of RpoE activity [Methanoculleus thermophilus]